MKKKVLFIYFPIILGFLIYILFRSKSLFYFQIFKLLNLDIYIIEIRKFVFLYRKLIPNWFIYSLPDGLWIFSFGSALLFNFKNFNKKLIIFCIVFLVTIIFEYVQFYYGGHGSLFGTFDMADLVCFFGAFFLCIILNSILYLKNKSKIPEDITSDNGDSFFQIFKSQIIILIIYFILSILPTLIKVKK
ncbi:MAG: hypothetical protein ACRC7W_07225 [Fusobacteriaceae bacterium]